MERAAIGDDETTEADAASPSSTEVPAATAMATLATVEQQSDGAAAITPNKEEEMKNTDTSATDQVGPTKMATKGSSSNSMNENDGKAAAEPNPTGASEKTSAEIKDRAAAYSRGNSIGFAYDVPIESESDGTDAGSSSQQDETSESPNTGNVAAGVAVVGTIATGTIAAGVVANNSDNDEQPDASPTKPHNETTISDITEGTMPVPQVVKSTGFTEVVSPMAIDRDVSMYTGTQGKWRRCCIDFLV